MRKAFWWIPLSLAAPAAGQTVLDGGFEQGGAAWSVTNTATGAGAPGDFRVHDVDGPGPLAASQTLHLNAGKQLGATSGGVDLTQTVMLVAGEAYAVRFHYKLENTGSGSYTGTTRFRLIVDNLSAEITDLFVVGPGNALYGSVEDTFTAPSTGAFVLRIQVESIGVADPRLDQYIDNVIIGPTASVYCGPTVASNGCPPLIGAKGAPSVASPAPFDVEATGVLNNKTGLLFYGVQGATEKFVPKWNGVLCVQSPLRRTPIQSSGGNPPPLDCSGALRYDFNARIRSGLDPALIAGQTVHAQYWFRDPGQPQGIGVTLTQGLAFDIGL